MRRPGWTAERAAGGSGRAGPSGDADPLGPRAGTGTYAVSPGEYGTAYGRLPPTGWPPARPARWWPPTRREIRTALALILGMVALGAALAPAWAALAPRLAYRVVQPGRALPVVPEAEEYIAADGRFVLLTLGAGVLAGLVAWSLRRTRGPVMLVALAVGGLLAAAVTWRLGVALAPGYRAEELQEVGRTVYQSLRLGALAALVVEPFAAVLVYLAGAGFAARTDLGRPDPPAPSGPAGRSDLAIRPGPVS
jgi:hypothetical protein